MLAEVKATATATVSRTRVVTLKVTQVPAVMVVTVLTAVAPIAGLFV